MLPELQLQEACITSYRTTGPWGAGKGSNLTSSEVDGNFYETKQALDAHEPIEPNTFGAITVTGRDMTLAVEGVNNTGPFQLPAPQLTFRGPFKAGYPYQVGDLLTFRSNVYLVLVGFISGGTFRPEEMLNGKRLTATIWGSPVRLEAAFYLPGATLAGKQLEYVAGRPMRLESALAYRRVTGSADIVFVIRKNEVDAGEIHFAAGENRADVSLYTEPVELAAGDTIQVYDSYTGTEWTTESEFAEGRDLSITLQLRRIV
jgi:hypothetical protein